MPPHACKKELELKELDTKTSKLWSYSTWTRGMVWTGIGGICLFLLISSMTWNAAAAARQQLAHDRLENARKQADVEVIKNDISHMKENIEAILDEIQKQKQKQ